MAVSTSPKSWVPLTGRFKRERILSIHGAHPDIGRQPWCIEAVSSDGPWISARAGDGHLALVRENGNFPTSQRALRPTREERF